ncbi:NADAR family protein [Thermomonospora catenispora]|uniref:NADAR family protein n=1 Tax=Thermomonospora catenispora TaxID=2493090 RepID=UPI0011216EAE|nr:NADAR family protein [Thermomonospora catenispora]TNY36228.1 NADAR family protein [Thermomonospora catenispora]
MDSAEPRSVADVRRLEELGRPMEFLFFWGHRPSRSGEIGRSSLSQWWECPFTVDGVTYRSAEHWMMAHKALLFGDERAFARILRAEHPAEAKRIGRQVAGFDEATWAERRWEIVVSGNVAKFGQNPELGAYLLGTGDRILVEASPLDRVWGIGLAADDERASSPSRWRGLNLLGFALMEARSRLRAS